MDFQALNRSYPYRLDKKEIIVKALVLFCFASLFMYYFYLRRWFPNDWSVVMPALGYGLVVGGIYLVHSTISPMVFKTTFNPNNWGMRREALYIISYYLLIFIGVIVYSYLIDFLHFSWHELIRIFLVVTLVGSFPAMIFLMFNLLRSSQVELHSIELINQRLKERFEDKSSNATQLTIKLRNGDYSLTISDFMFAESQGNYVILHLTDQSTKKIRTTLRNVEQSCHGVSQIIKVHRAFIVNTDAILRIGGNAGGYQIELRNSKKTLPVSRTYTQAFKELLE